MEGRLVHRITDGLYCASCNKVLISSISRERKKGAKSILFQRAVNKGFRIPSSVFNEIYAFSADSHDDSVSGITISDCPVCGKVVRANGPACLHCGEELLWLGGIPYKKSKYPSRVEQFSGSSSKNI